MPFDVCTSDSPISKRMREGSVRDGGARKRGREKKKERAEGKARAKGSDGD